MRDEMIDEMIDETDIKKKVKKKVKEVRKMTIMVDDRERGVMNDLLEGLGFFCADMRLLIGDYVVDDVCIERKTIDDFCASIIDGRLDSQVANMKRLYTHNFILVSGRVSDRKSKIKENCVLGKITSLSVDDGVKVIMVDSDEQMAYVIKRLFERLIRGVK